MSVLKSLESRIAGLVEGGFSRAFRSDVRPVEIARRLAREMDAHRVPLVSRVYVPFEYAVFLGCDDFERIAGARSELITELSAYLFEHARRERVVLPERPDITIELDERLGLGEFGIRTTPVERSRLGDGDARRRPTPSAPSSPRAAAPPLAAPPPPAPSGGRRTAAAGDSHGTPRLIAAGTMVPLGPGGATIGRSSSCGIRLEDPNASRRHAEVSPVSGYWQVEDLGSTNGVKVNGERIAAPRRLVSGDRIQLGSTELEFRQD